MKKILKKSYVDFLISGCKMADCIVECLCLVDGEIKDRDFMLIKNKITDRYAPFYEDNNTNIMESIRNIFRVDKLFLSQAKNEIGLMFSKNGNYLN